MTGKPTPSVKLWSRARNGITYVMDGDERIKVQFIDHYYECDDETVFNELVAQGYGPKTDPDAKEPTPTWPNASDEDADVETWECDTESHKTVYKTEAGYLKHRADKHGE